MMSLERATAAPTTFTSCCTGQNVSAHSTGGSVPERVGRFARAVSIAHRSVQAAGTEAVLAAGALEALVAQTGPVDVVNTWPRSGSRTCWRTAARRRRPDIPPGTCRRKNNTVEL